MSDPTTRIDPPSTPSPDDCVLCGRCAAVCPLFAATGREELAPRAKFLLLSRLARDLPVLSGHAAADLAGLCLSCGRCREACPVGLGASELVRDLRAAHPGWEGFVWERWITRAGVLWPLAMSLGRLTSRLAPGTRLAAPLAGLDPARAAPPWLVPTRFDTSRAGRRVALFPGCVAAHARHDWLHAARRLLGGAGYDLAPAPDFSCCGDPLDHAGLPRARDAARLANVAAWRAAGRPPLAVFCASCQNGLGAYPDSLFAADEAVAWRQALTPLSRLLGRTAFAPTPDAPPSVLYHRPCHAPADDPDAALLARCLGPDILPAARPCCGFGGLTRVTAPDLPPRVAAACWQAYAPPPRTHLLTSCAGCAVQLAATRPPGVVAGHWLETILFPDAASGVPK